jgi:integrase
VREAKNGTPRDVPLSTRALAVLLGLGRSTGRIFSRLTSDTLKHLFARLVKRCEFDNLHFHDLRHTSITRYARAGFQLKDRSAVFFACAAMILPGARLRVT